LLKNQQAVIGVVKKERVIYLLDTCKIHIDHIDGQSFVEIEAIDREGKFSMEELKSVCLALKEKLHISDRDLLATGYLK
jgi:adenylate cyclase class IV